MQEEKEQQNHAVLRAGALPPDFLTLILSLAIEKLGVSKRSA